MTRIFAKLESYLREPSNTAGCLTLVIEWKQVAGENRGGKITFPNVQLSNNDRLRNLLRGLLLASLIAAYPSENFKEREVVLVGV